MKNDLISLEESLTSDFNSLFDCLDIPVELPISEAIEKYNYIPEKQTFYSFYQTPFFKPFYDFLENPEVRVIAFSLPSQVGKSEFLKCTEMELARRYSKSLILHYCPDERNALEYVKNKLSPSVVESSKYYSLLKKSEVGIIDKSSLTKNSVSFLNGSSIIALGVNGKNALVSKTSRFIIIDEYSAMDHSQKIRGDVLSLAKTRQTSFSYGNRKIIVASTPLEPNKNIDKLYKESRQYSWKVPCPHCGEFQELQFTNLKADIPESEKATKNWNKIANDVESGKYDVYYQCPFCDGKFNDKQKLIVLNKGKLVCTGNENLSMKEISFHLNGLYSSEKWEALLSAFFRALGDSRKMQEFKTQKLAETFEVEKRITLTNTESFPRGEYPKGIVPDDTFKLVCGLDCQQNRFYYVIIAYTNNKKTYIIDWGMPPFDSNNYLDPESFPFQLDDKGYNDYEVDKIVIDTGFNSHQLRELSKSLSNGVPAKGYVDKSYYRLFKRTPTDPELLHVEKNISNDYLEGLISNKEIFLPNNIDNDDELLIHFSNVIKLGDLWHDRDGANGRVDYRDALRLALVYCKFAEFDKSIDESCYWKNVFNKK